MDMRRELTRSLTRAQRRPWRPASGMRLSMFDTPVSLPMSSRGGRSGPAKERKIMSLELALGGMAVEFKARNLAGLLGWLALDATLAAIVQQLMQPRQFRTWHGRVAGFIPYDFRRPTLQRVLNAIWAPDNPRLFTDTAFGVGWSVNLAQLPRVLAGTQRNQHTERSYRPPTVEVGS